MDEHNINVSINLNLPAVRLLYRTFAGPTTTGRVATQRNRLA